MTEESGESPFQGSSAGISLSTPKQPRCELEQLLTVGGTESGLDKAVARLRRSGLDLKR